MASKRLMVMISSRCHDKIKTASGSSIDLSVLRRRTKQAIEAFQLFERDTFTCWIDEDEPTLDGGSDIWDHCLDAVRQCDVLLVLFNGNAGWGKRDEDVGICHAEYVEALRTTPAKMRIIDIQQANSGKIGGSSQRNARFAELMTTQEKYKSFATNDDEARRFMLDALQDAVVTMAHAGLSNTRRWDTGAPLDWSRMDYSARKAAMEAVLRDSLKSGGALAVGNGVVHQVENEQVYFACHAIPAAMAVAAAREMVGRPFLRDHELLSSMPDPVVGPVHIIACQKGATENQATNLLGFPDATIVNLPFGGIYVADNIQRIQLLLLPNCRDDASTRFAVQRFFDWLISENEAQFLAVRARGRKGIVSAIAAAAAAQPKPAVQKHRGAG